MSYQASFFSFQILFIDNGEAIYFEPLLTKKYLTSIDFVFSQRAL